MQSYLEAIKLFNTVGGMVINTEPTIPSPQYQKFFIDFIKEELSEYEEAAANNDIVGVADAHFDILYVLGGSIIAHGLSDKAQAIFDEIQSSNMSKFCDTYELAEASFIKLMMVTGEDMSIHEVNGKYVIKRDKDGKIQKGIGYYKPNLRQFFD